MRFILSQKKSVYGDVGTVKNWTRICLWCHRKKKLTLYGIWPLLKHHN